jgi:hypothetical protein
VLLPPVLLPPVSLPASPLEPPAPASSPLSPSPDESPHAAGAKTKSNKPTIRLRIVDYSKAHRYQGITLASTSN